MSISVDDSHASCFLDMEWHGLSGTFYAITPLDLSLRLLRYPQLFVIQNLGRGHELGCHTVNHPCEEVPRDEMEAELRQNIEELHERLGVSRSEIVTLGWPCGFVQHKDLAAQYFLGARGYRHVGLEDTTPEDIMNLRAYDVTVQDDAKELVIAAEEQGKWLNLVFHRWCPDDGAIEFATSRDLWIAPVGDVVKYILKRDGLVISKDESDDSAIRFRVERTRIPPSRVRDFEEAFGPSDVVTLRVGMLEPDEVIAVVVDGSETPHTTRQIGESPYVLIDLPVSGGHTSLIEIVRRAR